MTTSTLRPNGTISAATVTGAASGHAATSDDSDSSYVTALSEFDMGTVSMGTGAVTKTIKARGRVQQTGYSHIMGVRVTTSTGTYLSGAGHPLSSTSIIDLADSAQPVTLSQAQVDGLRMYVSAFNQSTFVSESTTTCRAMELYADLVYVVKPVTNVDAVSPDPYVGTIVPISWVNTLDGDGGAQTRFRLKVFTAAQYGAGGFDPETSTPFYDSGETVSAALTANTGTLDSGVTYRAYVKVAQTVNGVSHWSDWDYDQFEVDVATADVDTVAAVGSNSTASITVTVERDTGSEAWSFVEVERSIDNGTTWSPVRGATYVDATGDADTFVVTDYEVGNGVATLYRARATRILSDLPITGSWAESSPSASWSSNDCWLKAPGASSLNTTFALIHRDSNSRGRRSGVFQVIGAAAPVVVSDVLTSRSGSLLIESYEADEAADILALLDGAAVLLVQLPAVFDVTDFYAAVTSADEVFVSERADVVWRRWAVNYVEVNAPADPDASAP